MKVWFPNDKVSALCQRDGRVTATFQHKDVSLFSGPNTQDVVKNVLVGVCDRCGDVLVIPAQSTPHIRVRRIKK